VPRDRPEPPPFEPAWLERSLDRYLAWGLVFMLVLLAGFIVYKVREPELRKDALRSQTVSYTSIGRSLYATSCAECHGKNGVGGSAPTLNAKEFLKETTDEQIHLLVAGGISGTDMPAWSQDFGGTLTDEQVNQLVTYLRSLAPDAPSVPDWRQGHSATTTG
jgi:mono/diheme cytochrome c family protein